MIHVVVLMLTIPDCDDTIGAVVGPFPDYTKAAIFGDQVITGRSHKYDYYHTVEITSPEEFKP